MPNYQFFVMLFSFFMPKGRFFAIACAFFVLDNDFSKDDNVFIL